MKCIWNVECIVKEDLTEEKMQEIVCSKIANVLINENNQNCTLVNQE